MKFFVFLPPLLALLLAPLFSGFVYRVRAFFAGRQGQPILQPYYDIAKLLRKGAVYSTSAGSIFKLGPLAIVTAPVLVAFLIPFPGGTAPLSFTGDILFAIALFAAARFATVAAALDTGSPFEGMGASREVFFAALAEPVLLVALIGLARQSGEPSFAAVGQWHSYQLIPSLLIGSALFLVLLAENARIPFDDPTTHLELTMIHEVMVLDHGGVDLGLIQYGASVKLWLFALLVVNTAIPPLPGTPLLQAAVNAGAFIACGVALGAVESSMARLRLVRVPQLLVAAFALAVMGFAVSG